MIPAVPSSHQPLSPGQMAQLACVIEATARKPGNVHRLADFDDLTYPELMLAASAIAEPLDQAQVLGIGRAVLEAIVATSRLVRGNPNLGMVLLLAPMTAVPQTSELAAGLEAVLAATTIEDSQLVYQAIRLARPGGMGQVDQQDLSTEPSLPLQEIMALAADRDLVARQYATGYSDVLDLGLPALLRALVSGRSLETAVVGCHLELLAQRADTLIARKFGLKRALKVSRQARLVLDAGWPDQSLGRNRFREFDSSLRLAAPRLNPGATADLVAATLFAALRNGKIKLPIEHQDFEPRSSP